MRRRIEAALGVVVATALAMAGCAEPVQYGGPIAIDHAGVAARYARLCRVRGAGGDAAECPPPSR